jgi:hypothetical protein
MEYDIGCQGIYSRNMRTRDSNSMPITFSLEKCVTVNMVGWWGTENNLYIEDPWKPGKES